MTSPLHAALGYTGDELTFDLIELACQVRLPEGEQIDFKRDLPLPTAEPRGDSELRVRTLELAKDIAAMANGRGGQLIYGVRDEDDRAVEVVGVGDLSDGVMARRIRQVAFNHVYPPIQVACVAVTGGEGLSVLVVEMAESTDAPHLVQPHRTGGNDGWFVAPYRSGSDTVNMVEKQLESAYRELFEGAKRRRQGLLDAHEELISRRASGGADPVATVVAVLQPTQPQQALPPERSADVTAYNIVRSASALAAQMAGDRALRAPSLIGTLLDQAGLPRRALRRFVFHHAHQRGSGSAGLPAQVSVEIHDDATIGFAWQRGGTFLYAPDDQETPPAPCIGSKDMDAVAIMLVALMQAACEERGTSPDYAVRVELYPPVDVYLIPDGGWRREDLLKVPPPPAVEAEVRMSGGPDERAADMFALAQDLTNMVEESYSAFEAFWELPTNISFHPILELADRLFGAEPVHPVSGKTMR